MPKFKVKPYENYLVLYPNSFEVKEVHPAGSIVTVENPANDNQMNKLEPYEESKVEGGSPAGGAAPAGAPAVIIEPQANNEQQEDKDSKRKRAQQALAGF